MTQAFDLLSLHRSFSSESGNLLFTFNTLLDVLFFFLIRITENKNVIFVHVYENSSHYKSYFFLLRISQSSLIFLIPA